MKLKTIVAGRETVLIVPEYETSYYINSLRMLLKNHRYNIQLYHYWNRKHRAE